MSRARSGSPALETAAYRSTMIFIHPTILPRPFEALNAKRYTRIESGSRPKPLKDKRDTRPLATEENAKWSPSLSRGETHPDKDTEHGPGRYEVGPRVAVTVAQVSVVWGPPVDNTTICSVCKCTYAKTTWIRHSGVHLNYVGRTRKGQGVHPNEAESRLLEPIYIERVPGAQKNRAHVFRD